MPKRRAELAAAEDALKWAASELAWTGETAELVDRIPPRAKASAVQGLLTSRGGRFAAVENAQKTLEDAGEKLANLQARIEAIGTPRICRAWRAWSNPLPPWAILTLLSWLPSESIGTRMNYVGSKWR